MPKVKSYKHIGRQQTYDLEIDHKDHQFYLANGLLTSNSHSISYSYNSYQCAWLYTYYEKEWIKACLDADPDPEKTIRTIASLGYKIELPDILNSLADEWQINDYSCIPPLTAVKGVGKMGAYELIKTRKELKTNTLDEFLFCLDEKGKRKFRWSKFNKKCFDALIKIGAFKNIDCDNVFSNEAHMFRTFTENFDDIKKEKQSVDILAKEVDNNDWTRREKIEIQKELLGVYDKTLLFTPKVNRILREYDVLPLSDLCEEQHMHWFIVKSYSTAKTKNGKKYYKLKISDIDDKVLTLNYFKEDADIKVNSIYVGQLFRNEQWVNMPFNSKLTRIKD